MTGPPVLTARQPFSVRHVMRGPGDAVTRFRDCFAEGRRFIADTSIRDLLQSLFQHDRNREALAGVVHSPIHVGFLFPGDELSLEAMGEASRRAGFGTDYRTFPSTVVARELGLLAHRDSVPTRIFSAVTNRECARPGYVEAFIPEADPATARGWVDDEIATHVGLQLADHEAIGVAHEAFLGEGFEVAGFMEGRAIPNPGAGVSVIYYEKPRAARVTRIELLWPMAGAR